MVPWGSTPAGTPIVEAVKALPRLTAARKPGAEHIHEYEGLVTGSWRRLVFTTPAWTAADRPAAYTFCLLEALHSALRRRDVYAVGADRWGDPRAELIPQRLWVQRASVLTVLGWRPTRPAPEGARRTVDAAYKQVAAGLAANPSVSIKGGKLNLSQLEARRCRTATRRCTMRCRRCCRASTTRSCCWR